MTHRIVSKGKIKKVDIVNTKGRTATQMTSLYNPDYMINLAQYCTDTSTNIVFLEDENVKSGYLFSKSGIGIRNRKELVWCTFEEALSDDNIFDFIGGAPTLIVEGKKAVDWGNKYSSYVDKKHIRSAIGLTKDGGLVMYVSDTELTIDDLVSELLKLGCYYALNLDGGGSSHLQEGKKVLKRTYRSVASWMVVQVEKEETNTVTKIMIDPGHGVKYSSVVDSGAVGKALGLKEKDVTLRLSKFLEKELRNQGLEVLTTRTDDSLTASSQGAELSARAKKANSANVDFFVSLHTNSFSDVKSNGVETFILARKGEAEKLATSIQSQLTYDLKRTDRGVKTANYAVLRETNMPATLVELCFISNEEEERLLSSDEFLQKAAKSICIGVTNYLNIQYKEETNPPKPSVPDESSDWAKESWKWAIENGIVDGKDPKSPITKEQAMCYLHRYHKMVQQSKN